MRSSLIVLVMALCLCTLRVYGNYRTHLSNVDPDDTWTVIEYPEGQEVTVDLKPGVAMPDAKAIAHVMRKGNETTVNLEVSGASSGENAHQVYVVDSLGNATLLGTLNVTDGNGSLSEKTALSKFMIVVSPESDLTAIGTDTKISLRSTVPEGFTVVAKEVKSEPTAVEPSTSVEPASSAPAIENTSNAAAEYEVPLLAIGSLKRGTNTNLKTKFGNGYENAKASAVLRPLKNGPTHITIRLTNLSAAPEGTQYAVWEVGPDNAYTSLGHLSPAKKPREWVIDAETSASDFGLLITFENAEATVPSGSLIATIVR